MSDRESLGAYFTDRCPALIDTRGLGTGGPDLTPCGLTIGHEGPHEPVKIGAQTISRIEEVAMTTKDAAREAELRADYVAQLEALDAERYEAQARLAQVLGWGDFRECSAAQQEKFAAWAQEVGLPHLGNPHIRKELFA